MIIGDGCFLLVHGLLSMLNLLILFPILASRAKCLL